MSLDKFDEVEITYTKIPILTQIAKNMYYLLSSIEHPCYISYDINTKISSESAFEIAYVIGLFHQQV